MWSRSRCSSRGPTGSATTSEPARRLPLERLLVERAYLLDLTAPEMTVLVGGLRALGANHGGTKHGVFTDKPGVLTNDFFVNLLDMSTAWKASESAENVYVGMDRAYGCRRSGRPRPMISCSARTHSSALWPRSTPKTTTSEKFVEDFVAAWVKVMNNDRFDLS